MTCKRCVRRLRDLSGQALELEHQDGTVVFVATASVIGFCEHGINWAFGIAHSRGHRPEARGPLYRVNSFV